MKPLLIANWKMNPLSLEGAIKISNNLPRDKAEIIICPPFIFIEKLKKILDIGIGAQNCFWEEAGAFTGEISTLMLKLMGVTHVIVGHSERREIFKENNLIINKKIKSILKEGLIPILCIGETKIEKESGETWDVLKKQLKEGLTGVNRDIIIAYEPIWAIGSGIACSSDVAEEVMVFIKKNTFFDNKILYGGSVNSNNVTDYSSFSGFLIGGASLNPVEFNKIIEIITQ